MPPHPMTDTFTYLYIHKQYSGSKPGMAVSKHLWTMVNFNKVQCQRDAR